MPDDRTLSAAELGDRGFHWREGWYFRRFDDASVRVTKYANGGASRQVEHVMVIPPNEWASIVASVSAHGENGETHRGALAFHMGKVGAST
jgi:hypothetical protein